MMYRSYIKRIIDFIIASLIFPLFLVLYISIAILIKLDDGGPIFYCGSRVGKGLKKFKMYKFRSMVINAPDIRNEDGSTYNERDDRRQTRIGRFLRKTSIDEIPQILNVIKGDMSIIGPRPSPTGNMHLYSKNYLKKFSVRPGITGYTQAYFRNNASVEEKKRSDVYYVENLTFKLDFKILLKTISTVLKREGLYTNNSTSESKRDERKQSEDN
jgi:lipopolysaccharide/colanic/teichoic acid biosynthesis glycosyltransferase